MKKSLKGSLRGNDAKKGWEKRLYFYFYFFLFFGKSCFNVKNYFHISVSHLSYKIKIFFRS